MKVKWFLSKVSLFLARLMSAVVVSNYCFAQGFVERVGGPHEYQVNLSGSDINNTVNFVLTKDFKVPGNYSGTVYCSQKITDPAIYYRGASSMMPSRTNPGFYILNDYLDVKVEIWIAGNLRQFVTVPFDNISNKNTAGSECLPPSSTRNNFASGGEGKVTFKVTKKIVNGVAISNRELVQMFGRQSNITSGFSSTPMVKVNIDSAMLFVPDKCVINEGRQIEVDFGENNGVNINNKNITKAIPVAFKCEGGAFETGKLNIKLAISGIASSFDTELIKTNKDALGVKFTHEGIGLTPNFFYPVDNIDNSGRWDLVARLVANNNQNIEEGDFYASATVVATFL